MTSLHSSNIGFISLVSRKSSFLITDLKSVPNLALFVLTLGRLTITSSSYFPQSNGQAESAVKNTKYILIKCLDSHADYQLALLEFRRVPRNDAFLPAQLMFGFNQRGILPSLLTSSVDILKQIWLVKMHGISKRNISITFRSHSPSSFYRKQSSSPKSLI